MQDQDSDGQLLQSFATTRDEEAFRRLTQRHLGLVFHTALRRTGNRALSEDISQNVLLALARKAGGLAKEPERLPGWLHRATLYEASKAMRAESSYQRRKQQSQEEATAATAASEIDPTWHEVLPHLDLALDKLPESDRRVLLLHYFEDHPFAQIAEHLGKNSAAVRKQSQRALEKLSRILRTKGIALSVTALGAGLATQTAKAVPEALIHSASSFALAGSSSPLAFSISAMIASKPKVVIPLALLLLVTPLVLQQLAIAKERDRIQSLHDSLASSAKADTITARRAPANASNHTTSNSIDIMVLAKEKADASRAGGETRRRFEAKLAGLDTDTLADLIRKAGAAPLGFDKKIDLLRSLVDTISKTDPERGLTAAVEGFPEGASVGSFISGAGVDTTLSAWVEKDPKAAMAWFRKNKDLPKLNVSSPPTGDGESPLTQSKGLESNLIYGLIKSSRPDAASYLTGLPETERLELLSLTMNAVWDAEMRGDLRHDWLPPFLQIMRETVPPSKQEEMVAKLARGADSRNLRQVLAGAGATQEETAALARAVAQQHFDAAHMNRWQYGEDLTPLDPDLLECVEGLLPGRGQEILREAEAATEQAALQKATRILAQVRAGSLLSDNLTFSALTRNDLSKHIPEALELTSRIKDPGLRQRAVDFLNSKANTPSAP
ncbi:sigma-70 family RNA polymerase sigma factor [Haloferula sp. BvORR071]|uniref:RNA polymerase sigma factor n=1 Tax=Haloferula sp. BvORR071 TaxID=1396141 RepID=UPI000550040E|nr:sigma-70 family RNA polymerase sigma factor [Haloferula sp. BvORR071]